MKCVELHLYDNKLQRIPDLTKYRQFAGLTGLYIGKHNYLDSGNNHTFVQPEHLPPSLIHLDLSWTKQAEVPNFSVLENLQELKLCNNNLSVVQPKHLPLSLTQLHLTGNKLAEVTDFSQLKNLRMLNLSYNNISVVLLEHVPFSLKYLDLIDNKLAVLPDFSQHKSLQYINISSNKSLHTIYGLPGSLKQFYTTDSPVDVIKENAFHKNTYKLLREEISGKFLKQPPYDVYIQGLEKVLDYFTETSVETTLSR